ncbi:MAG: GNAT family N-acetyltransferase [Candidatus Tenebribacter mawsonii]|nr:GNAT family N-acetyltransferase [Candidatus Tenebribacter mawsonii]
MIKIDKQDYQNFYDIFNELHSYTFLLSALDGIVIGELYADDIDNPTFAIMLTADCYYIVGDLSNEQLGQKILKLSQSDTFNDFEGIIFANKNVSKIREIFSKHTHQFIKRNAYQLLKSEFKYTENTISSAKIVKITPDNISIFKEFKNFNAVYDDSRQYWDEYPKGSKINFCTALVKDETILSRCIINGESSSENSCELDIETFKGFRKNGYAETVCRETINEVINLGYDKLNWHCHADNIASIKTALKLGFKFDDENHLAWFRKYLDKK